MWMTVTRSEQCMAQADGVRLKAEGLGEEAERMVQNSASHTMQCIDVGMSCICTAQNTVTTSHKWRLSTRNVACGTEELNF